MKTDSELRVRAAKATQFFALLVAVLFAAAGVWISQWYRWLCRDICP